MPLIEAFLALALTMLSLAMIASLVVEFVHRALQTRAKDLRSMLERFYDHDLKSRVETELGLVGHELDEYKKKFIDRMTSNPLLFDAETQAAPPSAQGVPAYLKPLESLSSEDFFKRLAYTEIGKKIKEKAEFEIDEAVDSLSRSYDAFGVAATDLFKRKARWVSMIAGLVVVFGLNVNALLVLQQYLNNPELRAKVVAQADAISSKYKDSIEKDDVKGFKNKEEAEEFVKTFKKDVANLQNSGVTIGYSSAVPPYSLWDKRERTCAQSVFLTVLWALGVVGTGFLVGLGGPFWFDIVRKLAAVIQVVRGSASAATDHPDATKPAAAVDPMKAHKETFKKTAGLPLMVKAQAAMAATTRVATATGDALKAEADALKSAQDAANASQGR